MIHAEEKTKNKKMVLATSQKFSAVSNDTDFN